MTAAHCLKSETRQAEAIGHLGKQYGAQVGDKLKFNMKFRSTSRFSAPAQVRILPSPTYGEVAQRQTQRENRTVVEANSGLRLFSKTEHSLGSCNRGSRANWGRSGFDSREALYFWASGLNDKASLVRNDPWIKCRAGSNIPANQTRENWVQPLGSLCARSLVAEHRE
jgi:hypothetical protein